MDRAIILGASRGLGAELARYAGSTSYSTVGFGRKEPALKALPLVEYQLADFAKPEGQDKVLKYLSETSFSKLFYVAGGGPYGAYGERGWRDHEWAWQVTFAFPARVLHFLASQHRFEQVVLVGSAVAETNPDPGAASYCAAKHALKGLYSSLREEKPDWDVRLFSPGYMDTDMLPRGAAVREKGVFDPKAMAAELWTWSLTTDIGGHRVYPKHPS